MTSGMSDPTIQLPAGPDADATGHWQVSLSEIDAMCRKAARGVGLSWGLAEEAGRAARWLAAHGQPGPEALLAALEAMDGDIAAHVPDAHWHAAAPCCPIRTGAALSDQAGSLERVEIDTVLEPVLLAAFLCRAASGLDCTFEIALSDTTLVATPNGPVCEDWTALRRTGPVVVARSNASGTPVAAGSVPRRVSVETWRRLERLAHRIYVPATEASRAGAGAGQRDTD